MLLLLGATAQAQNALDTILKNKKVTIAVPPDYPPYGAMGKDFQIQGLDVDVANYIGVAKGEDKLRWVINGIVADARKNGDLDKMALKWLGRPVGDQPH